MDWMIGGVTFLLNVYLSLIILRDYKCFKHLGNGLTRSEKDTIALINSNFVKKSFMDRANIYFIYRTNIRKYIPFFNIYMLVALILLMFVVMFFFTMKVVVFPPTAMVLSALLACIPLLILEIMNRYQENQVRKGLGSFISCVGRWLTVKEDLFFAFEKASYMVNEPIRQYVKDFLVQVRMGTDVQEALDLLGEKVNNDFFSDFLINLKGNIKARGDLRELFFVLERQFYKLEKELERRKINSFTDKLVLYVILAVTLILCMYMLCLVPSARVFYTQTEVGKLLLLVFSVLFAGGTVLFGKFTGVKL